MTEPGQPAATQAAEASTLQMIGAMGGIGLISGVLIVVTFQLTLPRIIENKRNALIAAIADVVPGTNDQTVFIEEKGVLEETTMDSPVAKKYYACYDDSGKLIGVAVEAAGQGFQDILRILYGYSPDAKAIVGMKVLESRETPGLGDKIEKDANFIANFEALDCTLTEDGTAPANPIVLTPHGEKVDPWQVESITGATISSRAIAAILAADTAATVPLVEANLTALESGGSQ